MTTRNTVFEQNIIIKNIFAYCSSGVHEDFLTKKRGRKNKKLAIFLIVKTLVGNPALDFKWGFLVFLEITNLGKGIVAPPPPPFLKRGNPTLQFLTLPE